MTTTTDGSTATFTMVPGGGTVTIIERFSIPDPQDVEAALERAQDHMTRVWGQREDYAGALLLRHLDQRVTPNIFAGPGNISGVAVYSRWRPAADARPPAEVPPEWSLAAALPGAEVISSRTYAVDFTESLSGGSESSSISRAAAPIAHMGIFTEFTSDQEQLLQQGRTHSAESLVAGGVESVNFHRSLDGHDVVNFGQWVSLDFLANLSEQSGFAAVDHYWDGYADGFEGIFFYVVRVDPDPADQAGAR